MNRGVFEGFEKESFDFLLSLSFNNNKTYFEAERSQYEKYLKNKLVALENSISPYILDVDPRVVTGKRAISRIYRDVRFSKDKSPFRDHMWIAYKQASMRLSEAFCFYFEISPVGYVVGTGMYSAQAVFMNKFREKALAKKAVIEHILRQINEKKCFSLNGDSYKREKIEKKNLSDDLYELLNKRYFFYSYRSEDMEKACSLELLTDVLDKMQYLTPLYRFVHDLK